DLTNGPLIRVTVVRMAEAGDVLLLTLHHIVCDGWSMEVLFRELSLLYDGFLSDRMPVLPQLAVQYADFAVWQRQWLRDEVLERQTSYWRTKLAGVSGHLDLPTDRPRPAEQRRLSARPSRASTSRAFSEPAPLSDEFDARPRKVGRVCGEKLQTVRRRSVRGGVQLPRGGDIIGVV